MFVLYLFHVIVYCDNRHIFNICTQIIPGMFYDNFYYSYAHLFLVLNKRGGDVFQSRCPQNAVISAFLNAFLSMIGTTTTCLPFV